MTITEILSKIQELTNTQNTTTSSYPTTSKTLDINLALNKFMLLAIQSEGKWQVDDTNQTDYPVIFGDVVSGQQDYSFATDEQGNQILDIYKVRIKDSAGNWATLVQTDLQTGNDTELNATTTGTPTKYRLTSNGIFLTDIPSYNSTDGLEVYINRTPVYFTSGDVSTGTKKAGIPWSFHEYLAIRPSYYYCLQKGLAQAKNLYAELLNFEDMIGNYYSKRNKDSRQQIIPKWRNPR